LPRMTAVDDVRSSAADMHFSQTRYALDGTADARKDYEFDHTTFEHDLRVLRGRVRSASDRKLYSGVLAKLAVYESLDKKLWGDVQAKRMDAAKTLVNGAENDANDALVAALTDFQSSLRKQAQAQT